MLRYIVRRLLVAVPTLIALSLVTFLVIKLAPGSPFAAEGPSSDRPLSQATIDNLNRMYGLDRPLWEQYGRYMLNAFQGNLGLSYESEREYVQNIIASRFPISAMLGAAALVISVALGIALGVIAALRSNTLIDYAIVFAVMSAIAVPSFVLAVFAILLFAVALHVLPSGGWGQPIHWVLPLSILCVGPVASIARFTRNSLLEVLRRDYVRMARAKGLKERRVILVHALKNALIPVITVIGATAMWIITGSFIVESIFRIPGLGQTWVRAISARDFPMIMGGTLFYGTIVVVVNVIVDVAYAVVDPRVTFH